MREEEELFDVVLDVMIPDPYGFRKNLLPYCTLLSDSSAAGYLSTSKPYSAFVLLSLAGVIERGNIVLHQTKAVFNRRARHPNF